MRHPHRGEGWAIYDNGPSVFVPDGGEPILMKIGMGGASSEPRRSWRTIEDPEHGHVQADLIGARGEHHRRRWHAIFGGGWLVSEALGGERFEPDDGKIVRFTWRSICVGTPDYAAKMRRSHSRMPKITDEEEEWTTYTTSSGETLSFRSDAPPEPVAANPDQISLFGDA